MRATIRILMVCLTLPFASASFAADGVPLNRVGHDWPNWRGPFHDGRSRETGLISAWPAQGPKVLWEAKLPGGYCSVVVSEGRLFTLAKEKKEEIVLCFDAANGEKLWERRYPCDYDSYPTIDRRFLSGPRSTPAVDGGRVYAIGTAGHLFCLGAAKGEVLWQRDLLKIADRKCPEYGYCNSPMIVGDSLYVQPGGSKGNSLAALSKNDGSVLWQALDDPLGWATPVQVTFAGRQQIVYFTASGGVGVSPGDGKLLWRHPWKTDFDLNVATPIFQDGLVFLSSNYGRGCTLLRLKELGDPEVVWKSLVMQNHFSTSVLFEGHLYGFSTDRLRCVDFKTGKLKWDKTLAMGRGSLLVADGKIIALGDSGLLVLADASPRGYVERARWQALTGTCWSVPVLANGTLFLRNETRLLALEMLKAQ